METTVNRNLAIGGADVSAKRGEMAELLALTGTAVALPLVLGFSQVLTGVAVNMALALGAMQLRSWQRIAPLILLPSVSAVAAGVMFGAPVWGLVAMLPAIWAGNAAYAGFLRGKHEARGWFAGLAAAALVKAGVIGAAALILVAAGVLPLGVALAVAPLQILTAVAGGTLAWPAGRLMNR